MFVLIPDVTSGTSAGAWHGMMLLVSEVLRADREKRRRERESDSERSDTRQHYRYKVSEIPACRPSHVPPVWARSPARRAWGACERDPHPLPPTRAGRQDRLDRVS